MVTIAPKAPKAFLVRTRYEFEIRVAGYVRRGFVDFTKRADKARPWQLNVYAEDGRTLLWSTTGFGRRTLRAARMGFEVYHLPVVGSNGRKSRGR